MEIILVIVLLAIFFLAFGRRKRPAFLGRLENLREKKRQVQLATINQYRSEFGLPPLASDDNLHHLAKEHSLAVAARGACDYEGAEKRGQAIQKLYGTRFWSENCFSYPNREYGKRISGQLVPGWLRGQNRDNILSRRYRKVGIGVVSRGGTTYTTQIFAS